MKKFDLNNIKTSMVIKGILIGLFVITIFGLFISKIDPAAYLGVFALFGGLVFLMGIYVWCIDADIRIFIFTVFIMFIGLYAQVLTLSLDSPVRNVLSDMYDIAESGALLEEYKDNQEICNAINSTTKTYEEKFGFDYTRAVLIFNDISNDARIDVDEIMLKAKAKKVLDNKEENLKKKKEGTVSEVSHETSKVETVNIDTDKKENNENPENETDDKQFRENKIDELAAEYHAEDNLDRLRLNDALNYDIATKIDDYLLQYDGFPEYRSMIDNEIYIQRSAHANKMIINLCIGFLFAVIGILLFSMVNVYLDAIIMIIIEAQLVIQTASFILGRGDGANILVGGFTLLELVKPMYILIMAGLLSKKNKSYFIIIPFPFIRWIYIELKKRIKKNAEPKKEAFSFDDMPWYAWNRIYFSFWYNIITFLLFACCSEFGTVLSLLVTGVFLTIVSHDFSDIKNAFLSSFTHKRTVVKNVSNVVLLVFIVVTLIWSGSFCYRLANDTDTFVYGHSILAYAPNNIPELEKTDKEKSEQPQKSDEEKEILEMKEKLFGENTLDTKSVLSNYSALEKIVIKVGQRVYAFFHVNDDEFVKGGSGSQYYQIIKARSVAGWMGYPGDSYKVNIAINESDMVFAQLIHSTGVICALLLVLSFIFLLTFSYMSVCCVRDNYYRLLGMAIIYLLTFQNVLHIIINLSLFPISGVPLMYVSNAGTNQFVSLLITFMLCIISKDESDYDLKSDVFVDNYLLNRKVDKNDLNIGGWYIFKLIDKMTVAASFVIVILLLLVLFVFNAGTIIMMAAVVLSLITAALFGILCWFNYIRDKKFRKIWK